MLKRMISSGGSVADRRCIYENNDILVVHPVNDYPDGTREAVLAAYALKNGKINSIGDWRHSASQSNLPLRASIPRRRSGLSRPGTNSEGRVRSPSPREDTMTKKTEADAAPKSRRAFLQAAGIGAAATVAAPSIVKAQGPITMRWQSTWPAKDIFHEFAVDYATKVNDMTGGELQIEVLPAGAVVPAFGLLDAVSEGTLDGGHGVLVYHYGKQPALALWGSGPAFAMDGNMLLAWHKYGGGKELLAKLYNSIGANVVSFPYGPMPTQPLGWFQKPDRHVSPISKACKFRTVGFSIDLFTAMGAAVNALPGGEIIAAMDRGLLDAAEFNNASSDRTLGFPDVSKICMLQSYHQNAEQFEILFNKANTTRCPTRSRRSSPMRPRRLRRT